MTSDGGGREEDKPQVFSECVVSSPNAPENQKQKKNKNPDSRKKVLS